MRIEVNIPERHYNNIMAIDSVSLGRAPYKGIIIYAINAIKLGKVLQQEPTTKNNLGVDCISRVEAIKCLECDFDITGKENMKTVVNYINSAHDKIVNLPSITPQLSSGLAKNSKKLDGELDCISRADAIKAMQNKAKKLKNEDTINGLCGAVAILYEMSSVTPQEPTDKNFTKADIDAIVKAINEGWELRVNEILSKIRAEIEKLRPNLRPEQMTDYDYAMVEVVDDIVAIIDKYRADKE